METALLTNILLIVLVLEGLYIAFFLRRPFHFRRNRSTWSAGDQKAGEVKAAEVDTERWPPVKGGVLEFPNGSRIMPDPTKCISIAEQLEFIACAGNRHLEAYDQREHLRIEELKKNGGGN